MYRSIGAQSNNEGNERTLGFKLSLVASYHGEALEGNSPMKVCDGDLHNK